MKLTYKNPRWFIRAICLLCFLSSSINVKSQTQLTTVGTDFWFGFMNNFDTDLPVLSVFISSQEFATGTIEMPLIGWSQNFTIIPGITTTIDVPVSAENTLSWIVENRGVHITTDNPVSVYSINYLEFSADGTRILPKQYLDIEYVVNGYNGLGWADLYSQMLIVATEDGTELEITPACDMFGGAQAVSYTHLRAHETGRNLVCRLLLEKKK